MAAAPTAICAARPAKNGVCVRKGKEGGLQLLNENRQSGGEKSVTTIMYLLALQELTPCPFRLVDEINQGMDVTNERRVFDQIVKGAERTGNDVPQTFVVSPKLLRDLKYSPAAMVHTVFNGSGVALRESGKLNKPHDPTLFEPKRFTKRRREMDSSERKKRRTSFSSRPAMSQPQ